MALGIGSQSPIPSNQQVLGGSVVPRQGIYEESATQYHPLGTRLELGERVYYYAYANEALSPGKVACAIGKTFTDALADTAHPIGTRKVTITASAAIAAGELDEGYVVIKSGTGAGEYYKIKRTPAISNGAQGVLELYDGLVTAWSTSDTKLEYQTSIFKLQEANTGATELPVGVANVSITSGYYFWVQTWGPCNILMAGADGAAIGERDLVLCTGTAGAVEKSDAVGRAFVASTIYDAADNATGEYSLMFLKLSR